MLIEEITTWLYLLKVVAYHLVDASYADALRQLVARGQSIRMDDCFYQTSGRVAFQTHPLGPYF